MMLLALIALAAAPNIPPPNETVTVQADKAAAEAKKVTCTYTFATGTRTGRTRVCMSAAERQRRSELTRNDLAERMKDHIGANGLNN